MSKTLQTITFEESKKLLWYLRDDHTTQSKELKCIRNHCIALLMLDAGLRVGEVVKLLVTDLIFQGEPVTSLCLTADITKNHRQRTIPLSNRVRGSLIEMLESVWVPAEQDPVGYAFYGSVPSQPLSARQVERIIGRASLLSIGRRIHPHVLRHTFATRLLRKTSIRVVQELLGHANLQSTQVYTHPNREDLTNAIKQVEAENLTKNSQKT